MAPGLSSHNTSNLEGTIAKVYETLKRTEKRTRETKERAAKTLEDSFQHLSTAKQIQRNSLNPDRFSQSLDYTSYAANQERNSLAAAQFSTIDNRRTPNRLQTRRTSLISSNNEDAKKSPVSNTKLRTIIFKTLDRLFQLPTKPLPKKTPHATKKSSKEDAPLSLETLISLNQHTADTLPRDHSFPRHENLLSEDAYNESSSDDADSCWEYMAPLKIVKVPMEDSLELPTSKGIEMAKENDLTLAQEPPHQKNRYQQNKRNQKGTDKAKIKKRALERQSEKIKNEMLKLEEVTNTDTILNAEVTVIKMRPDSPIERARACERRASSLPNLIEATLESDASSDSTLSDCGSATFRRSISYCPCSTLVNTNIPSFAQNHENDDDACSTTSSFSSLQRISAYNSTTRSTHESTLPVPSAQWSALCKDVLVSRINVPIQPFPQKEVSGITSQAFQELAGAYVPVQEGEARKQTVQQVPFQNNKFFESTSTSAQTEIASSAVACFQNAVMFKNDVPPQNCLKQENAIELKETTTSVSQAPAPPPMPPPLPPPTSSNTTIRGLFPIQIITQRQEGNCIFNEMKDIRIEDRDVKNLKEKFPLKSSGKALKRLLMGKDKGHELTADEKKFLRNSELFLKTYRISNDQATNVVKNIARSIVALNASSDIETEWFTSLTQFLPKAEEIDIMRKNKNLQKSGNKTAAGLFVSELLSIENLHTKLVCIQFSLDFKEGSAKLYKWTKSFIKACDAITKSDKFVLIINVIMGLLQSLNPDEQSRIYGFDIQGLTRLATRTSEDGSSTFLEFVIEYILSKPDLIASVDFYKTFQDLPDVTKTSIKEMRVQYEEWRKSLLKYRAQVEHIQKNFQRFQISPSELQYAITFQEETEQKLLQLDEKLNAAQQSFNSCKERFGLMNGETSEVMFFESLSKFVLAYKRTYNEIIAQKEKVSKQSAISLNKSISLEEGKNKNPSGIVPRRKSCTALEIQKSRCIDDGPGEKKNQHKVNPRRKSYTPREIQDMIDAPITTEVGKGLFNLLTKNDQSDSSRVRLRKRVSTSSSKLLERN